MHPPVAWVTFQLWDGVNLAIFGTHSNMHTQIHTPTLSMPSCACVPVCIAVAVTVVVVVQECPLEAPRCPSLSLSLALPISPCRTHWSRANARVCAQVGQRGGRERVGQWERAICLHSDTPAPGSSKTLSLAVGKSNFGFRSHAHSHIHAYHFYHFQLPTCRTTNAGKLMRGSHPPRVWMLFCFVCSFFTWSLYAFACFLFILFCGWNFKWF